MSNNIVLIVFFAVIRLTRIEAMPTKDSEETWDMDSLDQRPEDLACGENEYYNDMRLDCEDHCHDRNRKLCFGFETFCWCNEGYIRDSSLSCVKIEDCLKDEERKSETLTSTDNNDFSKRLGAFFQLASNSSVLHNSLDTDSGVQQFNGTNDQEILDFVFGKPKNSSTENKPVETYSGVQQLNGTSDQDIHDFVFGKSKNSSTENKPVETYLRVQQLNGTNDQGILDFVSGKPENSSTENKPVETYLRVQQLNRTNDQEFLDFVFGKFENSSTENKPVETYLRVQQLNGTNDQGILDFVFGKPENSSTENKPVETYSRVQQLNGTNDQEILDLVFEQPDNLFAGNNNEEYKSLDPKPSEPLEYTLMTFIRECLEEPSAEN